MRLTAFKAQGFKSFPDAAAFTVGEPLIGVVGPNGCGKSNIVDAVRWVLGESRQSALRARALSDVLFNGSESRPPADWCGVDLKFANDGERDLGAWAPCSEIVVRRELGRDGQSFFYINGDAVRRRDVVALFRGTGLAPRAYGVVEQGMIGRVAEASPEELRDFVEEAAGVSHYKENRRETERRLSVAEDNLQQLRRIAEEVNKQAARLRRQAQTARRHENLQLRISELESLLFSRKREAEKTELAKVRENIAARKAREQTAKEEFENLKTRAQQARQAREESLAAAARESAELAKLQEQAEAAGREMENADQLRREAAARIAEDGDELAALQKQLADGEKASREGQSELGETEAAAAAAKSEAEQKHKQSGELARRAAHLERAAQRARAALSAAGGKLKSGEARAQMTAEEAGRIQEQLAAAQTLAAQVEATAKSAAPPTEKTAARLRDCESAMQSAEETVRRARATAGKNQKQSLEAEKQLLAAKAESAALAAVAAAAAGKWAQDPPPRLADVLRVEAGEWSAALDAALGYAAGAFVVDDLRRFVGKRGLPPPGAAVVTVAANGSAAPPSAREDEKLPSLISQLKAPAESVAALAPWLDGVYAAESESDALTAAAQLKNGEKLVTRAGVVYESRSVYARGETLGGFDWRRRMKVLAAAAEKREKEFSAAEEKRRAGESELGESEKARAKKAQELELAKHELSEKRAETMQWRERRANAERRREELRAESETLLARKKENETTASELKAALAEGANEEAAARKNAAQAEEELKAATAAAEDNRSQAQQAEAKKKELQARAEEIRRRQKEEKTRAEDLRARAERLEARLKQAKNESAKTSDESLRAAAQKTSAAAKAASAREAEAKTLAAQREKEAEAAEAKREECYAAMQNFQSEIGEMKLAEQERALAIERLNDSLEAAAIGEARLAEIAEENKEAATAECEETMETLRRRRDSLGGINFAAAAELRESETRAEELAAQINDIAAAAEELRSVIKEMDEEMRRKMSEMYRRINGEFDALFKKFFGGGDARLETVGEESLIDAGFEIRARPPGKRLFSARALSGGEKAAAALAFVFALLKLNPPPFCILDEVDAALDERRSDNFVKLLKELSANFQFIVITHNPMTLEKMQRLVGVTQEEKGVSKIVSVNLREALEAARG